MGWAMHQKIADVLLAMQAGACVVITHCNDRVTCDEWCSATCTN